MRRAERLFQIIQVLRRARAPITATRSRASWETSKRTVYRDIADLIGQRVPVRGEAGVGYVLDQGFDMPPLMLTPDEIEAAVLGAPVVAGAGDPALERAARRPDRQDHRQRPGPTLRPFRHRTGPDAGGSRVAGRRGRHRHEPAAQLDSYPGKVGHPLSRRARPGDRAGDLAPWRSAISETVCGFIAAWCELRDGFAISAPIGSPRPTSSTSATRTGPAPCAPNAQELRGLLPRDAGDPAAGVLVRT